MRKTITMSNAPKYRQKWIFDLLKKDPLISFKNCFSKYSEKYSKTEKTFSKDWKTAQEQIKTYQNKLQKEKERVSIQEEIKAVKNGLKTKIDRLMILQEEITKVQQELQLNECSDIKIINGQPKKIIRPLTPMEKSAMRKVIKELQSEISKMEGDYAPIKQDHTTQGEKVGGETITFVTIDKNGNRITETSN